MKKIMVMIMVMVMAAASVFANPSYEEIDAQAREMAATNKSALERDLKNFEGMRAEYNSILEQYPDATKWEHYNLVVETITFVDGVIALDKQSIPIFDDIIENGYPALESHYDEIASFLKREAELKKIQIKLQKKLNKAFKR